MLKLLQTFVDIALWRKGPQDLPASYFLLSFILTAYVVASFVHVQLVNLSLRTGFIIVAVAVTMMILWLWAVLAFFGRRQRFVQTLTATLGVGVVLATADILVRLVQIAVAGPATNPSQLWLALRFLAIALIMGRIFMQALDRGLLTGMGLTVAIVYSTGEIVNIIVGGLRG